MLDYSLGEFDKPTIMEVIKKYTIGLPGVIIKAISGDKKNDVPMVVMPPDTTGKMKPIVVSPDEQKMLEAFGQFLSLDVDKKEGTITLVAHGFEPIQTAELALRAQQLLQEEVTRLRVEKSQSELEYIQARYNEAKEESDRYQAALAGTTDRYQDVVTTTANIGKQRLQSKYNVANAIYMELAKQLEQAKMQVKRDSPIFAIIQPVTVPMKPDNSRAKTVIVWTFLGFVLGCGIVIGKDDDTDPHTFKGALNVLILGITQKYPRAKVLFMTNYNPWPTANKLGISDLAYVTAMEDVCRKYAIPCFNNYYNSGISFQNPAHKPWIDEGLVLGIGENRHFSDEAYDWLLTKYEALLMSL
jgi:hypothetical protein